MGRKVARKRGFGQITVLPSGRLRARYTGPDGRLHNAPVTYQTDGDAEAWLVGERKLISEDRWTPPAARKAAARAEVPAVLTFAAYAERWLEERRVRGKPLAARTRDHYENLLRDYLNPTFGALPLADITPGMVNGWFDGLTVKRRRKTDTGETTRAHTYALGRAIMTTATGADGPLVGAVNPFAVRGGGSGPSAKRNELVTSDELRTILDVIRPQWRAFVMLGLWTGLRFSEIAELRRSDVDLLHGLLLVRRSVARSRSQGTHVKGPKSEAGARDMNIPAAVLPALRDHLSTYVTGRDGLLFPGTRGGHLAPSTFYGKATCSTCRKVPTVCARQQKDGKEEDHEFAVRENGWYAARTAAGHPTLHFHDLRATGATLMAQNGATEAEIMEFLGDSTPQAAQRYVRAARSRMKQLTGRLSELAEAGEW